VLHLKCNVFVHTGLLIFIYMFSIFEQPPPSFNALEISDILDKEYSISGSITELYSDRDQNFHVNDGGRELIIKVSNPAEERSTLDLQEFASNYISMNDTKIKVPKLAGKILAVEKDEITFLIRPMTYIKGDFFHEIEPHFSNSNKLGNFIGRLSGSLKGFDHPGAHRKFEWDARQIDMIHDISKHIGSNRDRILVDHFLDQVENKIPSLVKELRMSVIHNDGNDHNILINNEGKINGIIDFGDMVYTFQSIEPAVAMAYIALKQNDPFPCIASMLKGYHSTFPLHQSELASTIYFMCARLCITVSMAAWRKRLFPDNKYLTISEAPAWRLLRFMEKKNLEEWSSRLVEYAN